MRIACIGRLVVPRPITGLAYRLARVPRSNITPGEVIAAGCFRLLRQLSYEFASRTCCVRPLHVAKSLRRAVSDSAGGVTANSPPTRRGFPAVGAGADRAGYALSRHRTGALYSLYTKLLIIFNVIAAPCLGFEPAPNIET